MNNSSTEINNFDTQYIPFNLPCIGDDEISKVVATLKSGWITMGPQTLEFENKFAEYIGAPHAIAVNSCTAAMHLSLAALNIKPGDEIITSPYTFAATAEAIIHSGASPVFADIQDGGFNIDPCAIEKNITNRTRAIMPVHFAGEPCKMDEILALAKKYNLTVIEDAAHALGTKYKGKNIGQLGYATCFSFYATKNLTTGEGGMITTNDTRLAEHLKKTRLHGMSRDAWKRYNREGKWYYEIGDLGYKYNFTDIQAAMGLAQLEKFDRFQQIRRQLVDYYNSSLESLEEIILPSEPIDSIHAWHLYVIRLNIKCKMNRNTLINKLGTRGIGTSVHFIPLHYHPFYQQFCGYKPGDFVNAERMYKSAISLPLYPNMTLGDVDYIAKQLKSIFTKRHVTSFVSGEIS